MKNDIEENVLDKLKMKIAMSNFKEKIKSDTSSMERNYIVKKKIIATVCASIVLMSGIVIATTNKESIKKYFRGIGEGVDSAAEHGYIENPEMDYKNSETNLIEEGRVVDNLTVDTKIENFLMDDYNISTEFNFKFDEKITEYLNLSNIRGIELKDLIVRDDENKILFAGSDEEAFTQYCENNNLAYKFGENNENYYNSGVNAILADFNIEQRQARLIYNMYSEEYPKSKKLYFSFGKIILKENDDDNIVTLKGEWDIELDVPEKMYNRTQESYKVISCDNEDFNVYSATVSDTGFEVGLIINGIEKPEFPEDVNKIIREVMDKYRGQVDQTGANKEIMAIMAQSPELIEKEKEYFKKSEVISLKNLDGSEVSYVEDSNGKRFECTMSPSRKCKKEFLDGNRCDFYETFGMTRYDASDKIKLVLYHYGEPITIELEKNK